MPRPTAGVFEIMAFSTFEVDIATIGECCIGIILPVVFVIVDAGTMVAGRLGMLVVFVGLDSTHTVPLFIVMPFAPIDEIA